MSIKSVFIRRAGGLALAVAALAAWAGPARADLYGYSTQTISGLTLTFNGPAAGSVQNLGTSSTTFANSEAIPGGIDGDVAISDASQAFIGAIAPPPENTFTPVGDQGVNYIRSDSLITPDFSLSTVAEGDLNDFGAESGVGFFEITGDLVVTTAGTVTLSFTGSNLLRVLQSTDPLGLVTASTAFNFVIQNDTDGIVFSAAPSQLNRTIGLNNEPGDNTVSLSPTGFAITTSSLAVGTYRASLSGSSRVSLRAVPEPASMSMVVMGALSLTGYGLRRRKAKRA